MPISIHRPRAGLLAACVATMSALLAPAAQAAPVPVDLRVVDTAGHTLTEQVQYTSTVSIQTDPDADCFGPPGGSGDKVTVEGPTALGAIADAAEADADLRPLSVTDQFSFGLGLCGIGGREAGGSSFWYLKHNHVGAQVGGDQVAVGPGDKVLWYLTPGFPPPAELELVAPANASPGQPYQVTVFAYDDEGIRTAATGAVVSGAPEPADEAGVTTVPPDGGGTDVLQATRGRDIPSNVVQVGDTCERAGQRIVGTSKRDRIDGTPSPDTIVGRGGNDSVLTRDGCRDVVNCGRGRDTAKADAQDELRRCNRIRIG